VYVIDMESPGRAGKGEKPMADEVRDALDIERVKLLKTDPDSFFTQDRRQPFGFVAREMSGGTASSEQGE
jgi:hypothetical protein